MLVTTVVGVAGGLLGQSASSGAPKPGDGRFPEIIRIAIIGLEGHHSEILEVIEQVPQIRMVAIAETSPALLAQVPRNPRLSQAKIYEDYRQMLELEPLDIVAIGGENGTRASIVRACAERKVAIVAEKPLATNLEELALTRKALAQVPFTMLLPMRFEPVYRRMRDLVQNGEIGEVLCMGAQKSYKLGERPDWMKKRETYGGTIPYIGIHMVDLMRFVSAHDFTATAAFHSHNGMTGYGEMENNTAVIFQMDNHGTANLRLDYLRPAAAPTHGDDRLRIAGTRGVVEYQASTGLILLKANDKPKTITDLPAGKRLFVDFLEALYNGGNHALSSEAIFRVNEIVLKAREAADHGQVVRF
jgi:predicted dehydrogenase